MFGGEAGGGETVLGTSKGLYIKYIYTCMCLVFFNLFSFYLLLPQKHHREGISLHPPSHCYM